MRRQAGFTLIELMIVVVIIGILAAIAIPNFIAMQTRAKEGSTKANMHTFQLAAEDHAVLNDGSYSSTADSLILLLPGGEAHFVNSFDGLTGRGEAWEDRGSMNGSPTATPGITSYADSVNFIYNVKGRGKTGTINLVLTSGS
jgi:prepilin-type N-terminal cleavage/methylation domain-containing protein